jgi:superfamily II DNA or RNA helicase
MRLRKYALDEAADVVLRAAKLRTPQRRAFEEFCKLLVQLPADLSNLSDAQLVAACRELRLAIEAPPLQLLVSLATGVGKTRLMGAMIALLFRAQQSRNFLVLAPRTAILEKLERESSPTHSKYLLIDRRLVDGPNVCLRGEVASFRPDPARLNLFIFSPQSITGRDRRFARDDEFRGFSLLSYLQNCPDLVVFMDEAHHLGSAAGDDPAAWSRAIQELKPRLHIGLTATPRSGPDWNSLSSYDLATCLREGQYTKAVDVLVEPRDEKVSDEDWDRYTIDFALRRLERKAEAVREYARAFPGFPQFTPVLLICARDTAHAEATAQWLREARSISEAELVVTHSDRARTETDIQKLTRLEESGSRVRVVVNVFQLTEGWDVANVYVIAPLRAMAGFTTAVQTMGRGLRLPAGRRTGNEDVDTLDVLCCGRETLEDVLRQATEQFGTASEGQGALGVRSTASTVDEAPIPSCDMVIPVARSVVIQVPRVKEVRGEPTFDFDVGTAAGLTIGGATSLRLDTLERTGLDDGLEYSITDFRRVVHSRVLAELRYISEPTHGQDLDALIDRLLAALGATASSPVKSDPVRFALFLVDEIHRRYSALPIRFELAGAATPITAKEHSWRVPAQMTEPIQRLPLSEWR